MIPAKELKSQQDQVKQNEKQEDIRQMVEKIDENLKKGIYETSLCYGDAHYGFFKRYTYLANDLIDIYTNLGYNVKYIVKDRFPKILFGSYRYLKFNKP